MLSNSRAPLTETGNTRWRKLGNPSMLGPAGARGRQFQVVAADEFVSAVIPVVLALRSAGATTLQAMADALNQRGIRALRGGTL